MISQTAFIGNELQGNYQVCLWICSRYWFLTQILVINYHYNSLTGSYRYSNTINHTVTRQSLSGDKIVPAQVIGLRKWITVNYSRGSRVNGIVSASTAVLWYWGNSPLCSFELCYNCASTLLNSSTVLIRHCYSATTALLQHIYNSAINLLVKFN